MSEAVSILMVSHERQKRIVMDNGRLRDETLTTCHGSNFLRDGQNVAGPAPVPLFRAAISLDVSGNIVVDKGRKENQIGKRDRPPFFLPLTA